MTANKYPITPIASNRSASPSNGQSRGLITNDRRAWEKQQLETHKNLAYDVIKTQFRLSEKTYRKVIASDVEHLAQNGWIIEASRDADGKGRLTLRSKPHPYAIIIREGQQKEEKAAISSVAGGLVWGSARRIDGDDADLRRILMRSDIIRQLELISTKPRFLLASQKANEIKVFLESYWNKSHRSASIDAGSTCSEITKLIAKIKIPDHDGILSSLDIFTNSSMIIDTLRAPGVSVGVIVIGGRMRKSTDACSGELTRQCLDAWHLQLDIAIVGTTNINRATFEFACDSEDESVTKNWILSHASLAAIAADSSKFLPKQSTTSAYAFSPISGKHVDLVLTDDGIDSDSVEMLLNRGVVVLTPAGKHLVNVIHH